MPPPTDPLEWFIVTPHFYRSVHDALRDRDIQIPASRSRPFSTAARNHSQEHPLP